MERKKLRSRKYLYFIISIVLIILIVAEVSQITDYHSSTGVKIISLPVSDQNAFIILAKLPGVSVNAEMFLGPSFYPYGNISASVPVSNTTAQVTMANFNSTAYSPKITVHFNSTADSRQAVSVVIDGNVSFTLTPSDPVFIQYVTASDYPGLSPSIDITPQYDYLVIQVSSSNLISYSEVSR